MGKQFPEGNFPGCMWGIIYALDYHHWQNSVRKMLPHKRHKKRKNSKCNKSPKTIPGVNGVVDRLMDAEASHFLVNQRTSKTSSTHKRSLKAHIRALVAEKIHKHDDKIKRGSNFPALLELNRTLSVKHVESSNDGFSKASNEWKSPIIFFPKKATPGATKLQHPGRITASDWKKFDMCSKENLMDYMEHQKRSQNYTFSGARETSVNQAHANQLMRNASRRQFRKYVDFLELFQVNEDLFQEFQQTMDVGKENCLHMSNDSNAKARLTKSGTFPVANMPYSCRRNFRPTKLIDRQTEMLYFPREVKLCIGPQEPEVDSEVAHLEDGRQRLEPQVSNGNKPSTGGKQMTRICDSSIVDDNCRDLNSCDVTDNSVYNRRSSTSRHRRTSSLSDSRYRYARLCDYSFSIKSKWELSKSIRLTNDYDISATGSATVSFKRNRSLPHSDSIWPLLDGESGEILYPNVSGMTPMVGTTATEDNILSESKSVGFPGTKNLEKCLLSDAEEENLPSETNVENIKCSPEVEFLESQTLGVNDCGTAYMDRHCEELDELTDEQSSFCKDLPVTFIKIDDKKVPKTSPAVSILGSCFQPEVASPVNSVSEGLEYAYNYSHEKESPLNSLHSSDADFLSQSCSSSTYPGKDHENPIIISKNQIHTKSPHTDDDADLNYVREILQVAGFNENGFHGEWYSSEQPLSPLIFDEVEESWWPHESECSQENLILLYHHQLLFDLINEVMLQINETSFTYYPRASTGCHVHPLRSTSHDEEVLKSLGKYIGLKPELDQPLDDPMPRDLAKADGWMNLQMESECVMLELEDLIFDELLDELIHS